MSAEVIIGIIGLAFALITAVLVAGKLLAAVDNLTAAVKDLKSTIDALEVKTNDHDGRLRVLEAEDAR